MKADIYDNKPGIVLSLNKTEKVTHWLSWLGFLIVMLVSSTNNSTTNEDKPVWLLLSINVFLDLLYAAFFYVLIFYVYPFWYRNKSQFYLRAFATITFFTSLFFWFDYWLEPWSGFDSEVSFWNSLVGAALSAFIFIIVSVGVFAHKYSIAKIRFLSEKGVDWHKAGMKEKKPNSWKDLIASAQYLIEQRFTCPEKLGVMGGSAGGIAIGRAITEQPDLFAAAVLEFPLLNTTRIDQQPGGYVQSEEFGSPQDSIEFGYLFDIDVYHHIQEGADYPALLLTAGKNDQRTLAWEPAKVAAKFETRRGNDEPTLFRLYEGGHGSSSIAESVEMLTDKFTFFSWKLGLNNADEDEDHPMSQGKNKISPH